MDITKDKLQNCHDMQFLYMISQVAFGLNDSMWHIQHQAVIDTQISHRYGVKFWYVTSDITLGFFVWIEHYSPEISQTEIMYDTWIKHRYFLGIMRHDG